MRSRDLALRRLVRDSLQQNVVEQCVHVLYVVRVWDLCVSGKFMTEHVTPHVRHVLRSTSDWGVRVLAPCLALYQMQVYTV